MYGKRLIPKWDRRIKYAARHADLLTAISPSTRREYIKIGIPETKIGDIPNGVNLKRFKTKHEDIRKILAIPGETKILLSVGRYHIVKGYEYLIGALPKVVRYNKNFKCLIIGKRLEILKPLIKKLSIENFVILVHEQLFNAGEDCTLDLEKIPNDLLLSAYKSSNIYISSSLIEGFALSLVEAMAAGLPIIATNGPGNKDAIVDGVNGILVPPKDPKLLADAIITLLSDCNLRQQLGATARELAKQYDWRIIADQYFTAYKSLISGYD